MQQWYSESDDGLVDAIEEGRIVRVPELYAKKEGLTILRRPRIEKQSMQKKQKQEEPYLSFDDFRKPLKQKSQVLSELMENFHWEIKKKRRQLGITRRKIAEEIGEPEYALKLVESGILPKDDFVIINKLQDYLKLNLRKDKKDFEQSARSLISEKQISSETEKQSVPFEPFKYRKAKEKKAPQSIDSSKSEIKIE